MSQHDKDALKKDILAKRGYWARFHDVLLERVPAFLKAYLDFQDEPARSGIVDQRMCELIYVAVDVSINHRYPEGGRRHMRRALAAGATKEAVLQTILIATALAARQPLDIGLSILAEERDGAPYSSEEASSSKLFQHMVRGSEAYDTAARQAGPLSPKECELVALAVCAAPDSLFKPGMRRHTRAALAAGASGAEIATVLQLAAAISIHCCTSALPAFEEAVADQDDDRHDDNTGRPGR